jgi:hypothetical protein
VLSVGEIQGRGRVHWARKRSNRWNRNRLVASVERSVPDVVHWSKWRRGERGGGCGLGRSEAGAPQDQVSKLRDGDPLGRVEFEDALQDGVQLWGEGKNGPEELGILHVGAESAVLERGPLPWVTATGQVHKNDAQAPHVVRR